MITAKNVRYFCDVPVKHLEAIARNSGYSDAKYKAAEFLGLTTGGQFCYSVTFFDPHLGRDCQGKVFVTYRQSEDRAQLDY